MFSKRTSYSAAVVSLGGPDYKPTNVEENPTLQILKVFPLARFAHVAHIIFFSFKCNNNGFILEIRVLRGAGTRTTNIPSLQSRVCDD